MRRPSTVIASSVASSAQCTSSSTSTVGLRRELELGDQQAVDVVRAAPAEASASASGSETVADQVAERAERPRDREVVARSEQHPRGRVEVARRSA